MNNVSVVVVSRNFFGVFLVTVLGTKYLEEQLGLKLALNLFFLFSLQQLNNWVWNYQKFCSNNKQYSAGFDFVFQITDFETQNVTNNTSGLRFWEKYFRTVSHSKKIPMTEKSSNDGSFDLLFLQIHWQPQFLLASRGFIYCLSVGWIPFSFVKYHLGL